MERFAEIHRRALARKGPELEDRRPRPAGPEALAELGDDRYLAEMTRRVFCAGFVWQIIDHKWDGFEAAFHGFHPRFWEQVPDERLEALMDDARIVRNFQKIRTVRDNARMICELADEHGSFGAWLAAWPSAEQIGLLEELRRRGSRLGGKTGQFFLRRVGWDGFILSRDVVLALMAAEVIDREPTTKTTLRAVQDAFNVWHEETGRPYCQLSRILSCSIDG